MPSKREVMFTFKLSDGKTSPVPVVVQDGAGAYEAWSNEPANAGKTKEDYYKSLKGARGTDVVSLETSVKVK